MAFTFTVEDGTIVPGANSYLTVAEADDILALDFRKTPEWNALTEADKELMLSAATLYLEDNYLWLGSRVAADQPLAWPRFGMKDKEFNCIAPGIIPRELKRATAQLAVWLRTNDGNEAMDNEGIRRFRSDDLEIEWQDGYYGRTAPEFLSRLLVCFGYGPNDRGFKPITRK
jgi:hypothetical protein